LGFSEVDRMILTCKYDPNYPNNTMGSFYFVLPEPLILKDNYEVAITNLCFPNHWDKYHVDFVFIYSDIIYNEIAFNENCFQMTYLRVKKTVNVEYIEKNFDNPVYFKVSKTSINKIEFQLRDQSNRILIFQKDQKRLDNLKIYFKLHFRKTKK